MLISIIGAVEKGKWEFISKDSIILEIGKTPFLYRHGFLDENTLAFKKDNIEEYVIFVIESKFDAGLSSIDLIVSYLNEKKIIEAPIDSKLRIGNDEEWMKQFKIVMIIHIILAILFFAYIILK